MPNARCSMRCAIPLLLIACLEGDVSLVAQQAGVMLSVDEGVRSTPIAQLLDGRWVSAGACEPDWDRSSETTAPGRLIATGDARVEVVRPVVPGSEEWVRLVPTIARLFDQREREQRLTTSRTAGAPRAVDWVYAVDGTAGRTYYFEASRRVANTEVDVDADTDPPGTIRIVVAGFLRDGGSGATSLGTKSELRWEQDGLPAGPNRPDLMPLGVMVREGRSIWVLQGRSGASVRYNLYEAGPGGMQTVLVVRMARC